MEVIMKIIDPIEQKKICPRESIKIKGIVEIINGDTHIIAENKFVQSMIVWLTNITSVSYLNLPANSSLRWNISTYNWDIYLGTNTTTPTSYNTISLASPIGTAPGTTADIKLGSTTNPSPGIFRTIFTCTWNAGTISGTVGEMALYLSVRSTLQTFGWGQVFNPVITETKQLVSRLSVADGSLSSFTINTANPLTMNWTVQYTAV
jgi:hypothetical protein